MLFWQLEVFFFPSGSPGFHQGFHLQGRGRDSSLFKDSCSGPEVTLNAGRATLVDCWNRQRKLLNRVIPLPCPSTGHKGHVKLSCKCCFFNECCLVGKLIFVTLVDCTLGICSVGVLYFSALQHNRIGNPASQRKDTHTCIHTSIPAHMRTFPSWKGVGLASYLFVCLFQVSFLLSTKFYFFNSDSRQQGWCLFQQSLCQR